LHVFVVEKKATEKSETVNQGKWICPTRFTLGDREIFMSESFLFVIIHPAINHFCPKKNYLIANRRIE